MDIPGCTASPRSSYTKSDLKIQFKFLVFNNPVILKYDLQWLFKEKIKNGGIATEPLGGPGSLHFIYQSYVFNVNAKEAMNYRLAIEPWKTSALTVNTSGKKHNTAKRSFNNPV